MSDVYESDRVQTPVSDQRTAIASRSRWNSPGRILAGLLGIFSGVIGLVVVVRTGIDGSLDRPTTDIFGTQQSAIVGLVLLGAGLLLLLSAASEASRPVAGAVGAVLVIAGIVGAAATASLRAKFGMDSGAGWLVAGIGVVALVAALLPARLLVERAVSHEQSPRL